MISFARVREFLPKAPRARIGLRLALSSHAVNAFLALCDGLRQPPSGAEFCRPARIFSFVRAAWWVQTTRRDILSRHVSSAARISLLFSICVVLRLLLLRFDDWNASRGRSAAGWRFINLLSVNSLSFLFRNPLAIAFSQPSLRP